jgi:hypothetical protein
MQSNLCIAMHVSLLASDEESDGKILQSDYNNRDQV